LWRFENQETDGHPFFDGVFDIIHSVSVKSKNMILYYPTNEERPTMKLERQERGMPSANIEISLLTDHTKSDSIRSKENSKCSNVVCMRFKKHLFDGAI
jgi:hypothetical protein